MVHLASLAQRFSLAGDLLQSVIEPRIGHSIQGRLQAGLLFTPAYISRIKAQVLLQPSSALTTPWTSVHRVAAVSALRPSSREERPPGGTTLQSQLCSGQLACARALQKG